MCRGTNPIFLFPRARRVASHMLGERSFHTEDIRREKQGLGRREERGGEVAGKDEKVSKIHVSVTIGVTLWTCLAARAKWIRRCDGAGEVGGQS